MIIGGYGNIEFVVYAETVADVETAAGNAGTLPCTGNNIVVGVFYLMTCLIHLTFQLGDAGLFSRHIIISVCHYLIVPRQDFVITARTSEPALRHITGSFVIFRQTAGNLSRVFVEERQNFAVVAGRRIGIVCHSLFTGFI